jgi:hypothetical protein
MANLAFLAEGVEAGKLSDVVSIQALRFICSMSNFGSPQLDISKDFRGHRLVEVVKNVWYPETFKLPVGYSNSAKFVFFFFFLFISEKFFCAFAESITTQTCSK